MLKKNEYYEVEITDLNNLGYGVARIDGIVTFINGAVTGDKARIKLIKTAKDYAVGRLEEVISPSPYRVEPDCKVFGRCGGCVYRHISREYELEIKRQTVVTAFRKQGLDVEVAQTKTDGRVDGYRNKAQYPVTPDGRIGYYARHTHDVVESESCALTDPALAPIVEYTVEAIRKNGWIVKHLYLRRGEMTGETMLCLVTASDSLKGEKEFAEAITRKFPEIKSVVLNINPEDTNVILGKRVKALYGEDRIEDILCDCRFGISSLSFYQVNRGGAELLYKEAIALAEKSSPKTVLDLYCGAGTIGLSYAKAHPEVSVTGIEIIPEAVENARENAKINGIENATFICADAMTADIGGYDLVFIDPPRKGMSAELVEKLCGSNIECIVYVSCDPTTLARDVKMLMAAGYKANTVTPVDMFPRTGHVETVVCLSRKKVNDRINFDINIEALPDRVSKTATYAEIKAYVLEHYGFKVSSLYIAQIKDKHGIKERENYNIGEGKSKELICPPEKEEAITNALKHFNMI